MNKLLFLCIGFITRTNTKSAQFETMHSDDQFISILTDNFYVASHRIYQCCGSTYKKLERLYDYEN